MLRALYCCFLLLVLVLAGSPAGVADDTRVDGVERVVAISDIHGAYDAMVETLTNVGVLDDDLNWAGGTTHLVIVGDILDRGPRSRDLLDLFMVLEDEAAAAGGYIHILLGNHESMNMIGDLRYVSQAEYAAFAADESLEQRDRWFDAWMQRAGSAGDPEELRQRFDNEYPPGYFALREAYGPDGLYGQWLLSKPVIVVINGTAYVHGGLPAIVASLGLDGVNDDMRSQLIDYVNAIDVLIDAEVLLPTDNHYDYPTVLENFMPAPSTSEVVLAAVDTVLRLGDVGLMSSGGPTWYRGTVTCSGLLEEYKLDAALGALGADRVVVGHTPTPTRKTQQRFNGRVIEVDTGMLSFYYHGSGNALVLQGDSVAVYPQDGSSPYAPLPVPRQVGDRPGNLTAEELEKLLEEGEVVAQQAGGADSGSVVTVSNGAQSVSAIFLKRPEKGFYPNIAAYRLDRLLALDMVPVTVMREVDGVAGSLQFLPDNVITEPERSASGRGGSAICALPEQWAAMYVFDVLIYNEGRSQQQMLYDTSDWSLILSEHGRAFSTRKGRPAHLQSAQLPISLGWRKALTALTDEQVQANFSDVLPKRRLRALESRRDELLESAAGR